MAIPNPLTKQMIEAGVRLFKHKATDDPRLTPWHGALVRLETLDVEAASEIAAKAFHNGAPIEDRNMVINCITSVAFEIGAPGHWFESLLILAAESGFGQSAYNAANLISDRAKSPADHTLAARYYQKAVQCSTNPAVKASSLANSCVAIRDGLITGTPDLPRAVEVYEEAAQLNLAVAMFNAANVSCWLKDQGHPAYAARAAHWLSTLIGKFDAGEPFVDIGGIEEVSEVYKTAKVLLADLHAMDQVEHVDVELLLDAARKEPDPGKSKWLRCTAYEHRLRKTPVQPKSSAWQNWLSAFTLMNWVLDGEPCDLDLGTSAGDSRVLKFRRSHGAPLAVAVVDQPLVESNKGVYRLYELVKELRKQHDGPCLAIGSKGLFVTLTSAGASSSYTVLIGGTDGLELIPIWPGATTDEVANQMALSVTKYSTDNTDDGNTIPILVNALGAGHTLDGKDLPPAIYVNVGSMYRSPVMSVDEARDLGCSLPADALNRAFAEAHEYWEADFTHRRRYWAS